MIQDTIAKLSAFIGQNWFDVAEQIDPIILDDGFMYRWLEPTTELNLADVDNLPDSRINIHVDANTIILSYSTG